MGDCVIRFATHARDSPHNSPRKQPATDKKEAWQTEQEEHVVRAICRSPRQNPQTWEYTTSIIVNPLIASIYPIRLLIRITICTTNSFLFDSYGLF